MTNVRTIDQHESTQTDLIRYFDRNPVAEDAVGRFDRITIEAKAHEARTAVIGEFIGAGVAWLWKRVTHLGETRSPAPRLHVESRVQF